MPCHWQNITLLVSLSLGLHFYDFCFAVVVPIGIVIFVICSSPAVEDDFLIGGPTNEVSAVECIVTAGEVQLVDFGTAVKYFAVEPAVRNVNDTVERGAVKEGLPFDIVEGVAHYDSMQLSAVCKCRLSYV